MANATARQGCLAALAGLFLGAASAEPPALTAPGCPVCTSDCPPVPSAGPALCCPPACEPGPRFWGSAEYLLWWVKDGPLPVPLITTGSDQDVFPSALGQPGTAVLFGGGKTSFGAFSGLRLTAGMWLGEDAQVGVEARGFLLEQRAAGFTAASDANGSPILARPIFDPVGGGEASFVVSFPGVSTGSVRAISSTRLWGAESNLVTNVARLGAVTADALYGFRYLDLHEVVAVSEVLSPLVDDTFTFQQTPVGAGSVLTGRDRFDARNRFYGGQLGGRVTWSAERLSAGLRAVVGLGCTNQAVTADGSSSLVSGATPTTVPGGILAVGSNLGRQSRSVFSVVPEVGLDVGYRLAPWATVRLGYNFLYWSSVVRPGQQIDRTVNPGQVPTDVTFGQPGGEPRPLALFNRTDFWAHGVNFGLDLRF